MSFERDHSTASSDGEPAFPARSTRRRFLSYLGAGAVGTALASGTQTLSTLTAQAATHQGATQVARFTPSGSASGVNVVLVHGFWADGSSFSRIIPLVLAAGHTVFAVQLPLTTSLADDITTTLGVLGQLQGPTVLVGHSYGGAVVTNAGAQSPNVSALVYASAFAPDLGESVGQYPPGSAIPNLYQVTYPNNMGTFVYIKQQLFHESFAQDVDPLEASLMATVQKPANAAIFGNSTTAVAWKALPSWYLISENDRMIPPSLQQMFASRMKAKTISIPSSHSSIVSHPVAVFGLIQEAANVSVTK
ncbi:alpha/beta hydrolase [Dictyobacter sp. S3.2.2.5]|uniref:Alpha/beta hydrolase n=1 Tax=Dictyobacter halimunensis TaxID=3026934 RepID=A0ABQ6FKD1_9CHLR|nr:alpha/beta hydrolase [Dictyobacter sp. S3.2.2.5]